MTPVSEVYNMDCIAGMKEYPDKYFDLAIVDPPYGINMGKFNRTNKDSNGKRFKANKYHNAAWDNSIPDEEYFTELFRVSKEQIIWGGNYFDLPPTQCFIFWYKQNPVSNFSDGELAWTSFKKPAKCFDFRYYGGLEGKTSASEKIHPTQKPIKLYEWTLNNFGMGGGKILDTHLGSGSSRIAAYKMGFHFVGFELDKEYYEAQEKRFQLAIKQKSLFEPEIKPSNPDEQMRIAI
jgi:site-specific DNA-methyltransferase (adenine-specific)